MRTAARRPTRASRIPFALVCCALIAVTMAALLALNIASAQASYSQDALQARLSRLGEEQQALRERLEAAQAPDTLERAASAQGLVRSGGTAFLSLEDGKVLGDPQPAVAPTPEPIPEPTEGADGSAGPPPTAEPPVDGPPPAGGPPTAEGGQP